MNFVDFYDSDDENTVHFKQAFNSVVTHVKKLEDENCNLQDQVKQLFSELDELKRKVDN